MHTSDGLVDCFLGTLCESLLVLTFRLLFRLLWYTIFGLDVLLVLLV